MKKRIEINLARFSLSIYDADWMVVLLFGPRLVNRTVVRPKGERDRKFVLLIIALVSQMQKTLRKSDSLWIGLPAEAIWDCGGDVFNRQRERPHRSRNTFCGKGGLCDIWPQRLSDPYDESCPYIFEDKKDAQVLSYMTKRAKVTENAYLRSLFHRESITVDEARAKGTIKRFVYGIGNDWDVIVSGLESLDPEYSEVFKNLPLCISRLGLDSYVGPITGSNRDEWVAAYLAWAKTYPNLQPPPAFIPPAVSPWKEGNALGAEKQQKSSASTVLDAFRSPMSRIVLVGDPGSGKTSSLQAWFQELRAASESNVDAPLPVFVDLTGKQPPLESLVRESIGPKLDNKLQSLRDIHNKIILLFDGLDRCSPDVSIPGLACEILGLTSEKSVQQVILSCKRSQWSSHFLGEIPVDTWKIEPFDTGFGGKALQYIYQRLGKQGHTLIAELKAAGMSSLASVPLLLKMVCDLVGQGKRSALFTAQRSCLIGDWITTLLAEQGNNKWYADYGCDLLARLAYAMIDKNETILRSRRSIIAAAGINAEVELQTFLDLAEKARILSSSGYPGRSSGICFVHQTIQDYFASLHLHDQLLKASSLSSVIVNHLKFTKWDESLLMAVEPLPSALQSSALNVILEIAPRLAPVLIARLSPLPSRDCTNIIKWSVRRLNISATCDQSRSQATPVKLELIAYDCLCALDSDNALQLLKVVAKATGAWECLHWSFLRRLSINHAVNLLTFCADSEYALQREQAIEILAEYFPDKRRDLVLRYMQTETMNPSSCISYLKGLERLATSKAIARLIGFAVADHNLMLASSMGARAVESLLRINSPEAESSLLQKLIPTELSAEKRKHLAFAIAVADPRLLFECRVENIASHWKKQTPSAEALIARDVTLVLDYNARQIPYVVSSIDLRNRVKQILVVPDEPVYGPYLTNKGKNSISPCDWLYLLVYEHADDAFRSSILEGLEAEYRNAKEDSSEQHEALSALMELDPNRVIEILKPRIERRDIGIACSIGEVSNYLPTFPEEFTGHLSLMFKNAKEEYEALNLVGAIQRLPQTQAKANMLANLLKKTSVEKAVLLFVDGNLWPNDAITQSLRLLLKRGLDCKYEREVAWALAEIGDAEGLRYLTRDLPQWLRELDWYELMQNVGTTARKSLLNNLRYYGPVVSLPPSYPPSQTAALVLEAVDPKLRESLIMQWSLRLPADDKDLLLSSLETNHGYRHFDTAVTTQ